MILSDGTLRDHLATGAIKIDPVPTDRQMQPASIDLRLGDRLKEPWLHQCEVDPLNLPKNLMLGKIFETYSLRPGKFILGTTVEHITLPSNVVARVEGCSSLGRLGLVIHSTAGFIDPGFTGNITLELGNLCDWSIKLTAGMRIGQIAFEMMDRPALRPYGHPELGSRYMNQRGPVASLQAR